MCVVRPDFELYIDLPEEEAQNRQEGLLAVMGIPPTYIRADQKFARITIKVEYGLPKMTEDD